MDYIRKFKVKTTDEADAFLKSLSVQVQKKIAFNVMKIEMGILDKELFKKLENTDIWEIRTLFNGTKYRLFAFWDTEADALIIATHGIIKKTQKTPKKEIAKAEAIRKDYFANKNKR